MKHRYRIRFGKTGPLRWIGHLDLQTAWERTIRRAELRMSYSKGFHPRPRMVFAAALPLGCTSSGELVDLYTAGCRDPAQLLLVLREAAPPGLEILDVDPIEQGAPTITKLLRAAVFTVRPLPGRRPLERGTIDALLGSEALPRTRRGKRYDLRPLIESISYDAASGAMELTLAAGQGATGRVDEILDELGADPAAYFIHRERLLF